MVLVIHIHKIPDRNEKQSTKGANPLYYITHTPTKSKLSTIAKSYDPPRTTSKGTYSYIADNIENWIEEAIRIRNAN
jgi:hypothetical protein